MPKCCQFSRVHGTWTAPIIHEIMIDYLEEKKITFGTWKQTHVDKNGFDMDCIESRWASKQLPNASPTVIWLSFVEKYLKYRSCANLPLAPTNPGLPYIWVFRPHHASAPVERLECGWKGLSSRRKSSLRRAFRNIYDNSLQWRRCVEWLLTDNHC